jgi:tyrosine-protein kinase Etk/Wzc
MATETRSSAGEGIGGRPGDRAYEESAQSRSTMSAEDVSLIQLLTPLVRRWKLLLGIPLICGIVTALVSLVLPSFYTAKTTLTPVASSSIGGLSGSALASLAGLAGLAGLSSSSGGSLSPDFIAEVLKSREVLTATLDSPFRGAPGEAERPLLDILGVKGRTEAQRINRGLRKFEKAVKTRVDHSTGIVALTVQARNPELAASIANRMMVILNSFNLERRQSQSREQARFTGERLAQAEAELHQAEAAELRFLQANREYRGAPILEFERNRLQRAVDLKQEVYVSLAKAYDEARISEVRDTPVITIIDSAVAPDRRSAPKPLLNGALGFLAGGLLAFLLVFLLEQRTHAMRSAAPEYRSFRQAWNVARGREPGGRSQSAAGS